MYSDSTILELVDLIYAAAGEPTRWATLLERLSVILEGSTATLHSQNGCSQEASVGAAWNIDQSSIQQYVDYYSRLNPCFIVGKHEIRQGTVKPRRVFCPDDTMLHSEFYNDYLRRLDAFDGAVATIFEDGTLSTNLTVFRPKIAQSFGEAECQLLQTLMPHFQRAFQLHNRIQGLERKGVAAADALEHLPIALVMLSGEGRVLQVNKAAVAVFSAQTALRVTTRGLVARIPSENHRLQQLIRGAVNTGNGKGIDAGGTMTITRELKRSLQLLILPLRSRAVQIGNDVPVAMVFVSDPDREPASEAREFGRLFALTPAETRLAQTLAAGCSLKEASEKLGVAESTVKSQLKALFAKTGTNRQARLVRLILLTLPKIQHRNVES